MNMRIWGPPRPLWGLADQGAGGGADQGAGGEQGGGQGGNNGAWTPPEGLPKDYVGKDANETLGKLLPAFTEASTRAEGLRTKLAGMPKAPDKPEMYTFTPNEKLAPYFGGDLAKDPVMNAAKAAFHKAGVPQEAFAGIIENFYGPLVDAGVIAAPYHPANALRSFATLHGLDKQGAATALNETDSFAKGLSGQLQAQLGKLPKEHQDQVNALLLSMTDTAAGNTLLRALSSRLGEAGIRVSGQAAGQGAMSREEAKKMAGDPRIDPANRNHTDINKRFDPELRKRFDEAYKTV